VHDARADDRRAALPVEVVGESIGEGAAAPVLRRVRHHPGRLLHHRQVLVLEQHRHRDRLRRHRRRPHVLQPDLHHVPGPQLPARGPDHPFHRHVPLGNRLPQPHPADAAEPRGEERIQAGAPRALGNDQRRSISREGPITNRNRQRLTTHH
jgi:hypothetical protein